MSSSRRSSSTVEEELSAASSFEYPPSPCHLEMSSFPEFGHYSPVPPPVSRSLSSVSSSSSFIHFTEELNGPEEQKQPEAGDGTLMGAELLVDGHSTVAEVQQNGERRSCGVEEEEEDDSLGEMEEMGRDMVKWAIFGLLMLFIFWKLSANWIRENGIEVENTLGMVEKMRAELETKTELHWELEKELATVKDRLETERTRRDAVEQDLRKAHERLESDLRARIELQRALDKTRAALEEAEVELKVAEERADENWMGEGGGGGGRAGAVAELTQMYRKAKQREWLAGNLKETSEWWVPMYWRVVRVTFFKER